jgi:hypothetical protein
LVVETRKSVYFVKLMDAETGEITIQGGVRKNGSTRFEDPKLGYLHGSTYGGSMIRPHWLGHLMHMEVGFDEGRITTSSIQNVEIIAPDKSWRYSMDWNKKEGE